MRLAEIANDVEQRRIEILKNNADRAKKLVKDAQARAKIKKKGRNNCGSHKALLPIYL